MDRLRRLACRIGLHSWETVGVHGFTPLRQCRRCHWYEVFTGHATVLYPPDSLRKDT